MIVLGFEQGAGAQSAVGSVTISAVILAGDRSEFLADSLASVLGQKGEPAVSDIVIAVFDNFVKPQWSRSQPGPAPPIRWAIAPSGVRTQGALIAASLRVATGQFLAFLDDDDTWDPRKIIEVRNALRQVPSAGLISNDCIFVGASGQTELAGRRGRLRFKARPAERVLSFELLRLGRRSLSSVDLAFNMSSMTISRELLTRHLDVLPAILGANDSFCLYCAIASGRPVVRLPSRLTRYRVHPGGLSRVGSTSRGELDQLADATARQLGGLRAAEVIAVSTGSRTLSDLVARDIEFVTLLHLMQSGAKRRTYGPHELLLLSHLRDGDPMSSLAVATLSAFGMIGGSRLASAAYLALRGIFLGAVR